MPRAFLITNRRYKTVVEYDSRDTSPERTPDSDAFPAPDDRPFRPTVWPAASGAAAAVPQAPAAANKNSLYDAFHNGLHWLSSLEQLADISLATAHRWHLSPPSSPETDPSPPPPPPPPPLLRDPDHRLDHHHHHHHHLHRHQQNRRRRHSTTSGEESTSGDDSCGQEGPQDLSRRRASVTPSAGSGDDYWDSDGGALVLRTSEDEDDEDEGEGDEEGRGVSVGDEEEEEADDGEVRTGDAANACPECGKRYSTSSNLARHRQTHRSISDKKARKCPHCDKVYVSMPAYSMHVRTHGQGCQCPFCGKAFSRPWLLQGHIRTHTGEKPFKCPMCSKAFADKSNLRAHTQTHSNVKPYVCARCGKAFALKSYLYKHEESSCMRSTTRERGDPSIADAVAAGPIDMSTSDTSLY